MAKGPKINYTDRRFTTRDNLGITASINTFQSELCPIITTVTPRAFYWIFATWNYYDYWKNCSQDIRNTGDFLDNHLRRNDYYFVMANLLTAGSDTENLAGIDHCSEDIKNNPEGPYPYNPNYFKMRYGGMQYYVPGCATVGFLAEKEEDKNLPFPKITRAIGEPLAKAFEDTIKDTEYYKIYRLSGGAVPKNVLEELGQKISLSLEGMDNCKELLRKALFDPTRNSKLVQSKDYLLFINRDHPIKNYSSAQMREVLYDWFCPGGPYEKELPNDHKQMAKAWEIVIGRQYVALSLELIWKYMLKQLTRPMDIGSWMRSCFDNADGASDWDEALNSVAAKAYFTHPEREEMMSMGSGTSKNISRNLENALKTVLSVYNRFRYRDDIEPDLLEKGGDVSLANIIRRVDEFSEKTVLDFISFVMTEWVLKQHEQVAFRKMMEGRDGYFVEHIDNLYYQKYFDYSPGFTGNRLMQLKKVMADLDMLG